MKTKGIIYLSIAVAAFAFNPIVEKLGVTEGADPAIFAFLRTIIGLILIASFWFALKKKQSLRFEKKYINNEVIMAADWRLIDISIWLMFSLHSKIHYFDEVFATYRLLDESMSRTKVPIKLYQFHKKIYGIFLYYANNHSDNQNIKKEIELLYNKMIMNDAHILGDKKMAKKAILQLKMMNYNFSYKDRAKYFIAHYFKHIIMR